MFANFAVFVVCAILQNRYVFTVVYWWHKFCYFDSLSFMCWMMGLCMHACMMNEFICFAMDSVSVLLIFELPALDYDP